MGIGVVLAARMDGRRPGGGGEHDVKNKVGLLIVTQ